jgi:hypothetical protein
MSATHQILQLVAKLALGRRWIRRHTMVEGGETCGDRNMPEPIRVLA